MPVNHLAPVLLKRAASRTPARGDHCERKTEAMKPVSMLDRHCIVEGDEHGRRAQIRHDLEPLRVLCPRGV